MWPLLLFLSILPFIDCSCPAGFELVKDGECRGYYATFAKYWDEAASAAIAKCSEIQGLPVIIHDEEYQSYWRRFAGSSSWLVLGIVCNTSSKKWEWADGSAINFKPPAGSYNAALDSACRAGCTWVLESDGLWDEGCEHHNTFNQDVYCTTQLQQPIPSDDGCDSFLDDSADGVCFQENSFVRRLAVSKGSVSGLFLGGTVSGKGGYFAWIDGSSTDYVNFYPGWPKSGLGKCLAMDTSVSSGEWMNIDCAAKLPVACIRDQRAVVEPTCSSETWKEGVIITSPGFPWNASTPCDYFLIVDDDKKVELEIVLLEANSCCDTLILYDGYLGGNVIARVTGEVRNATFTTSVSNVMRVSWQPNGGTNVMGVAMSFYGV